MNLSSILTTNTSYLVYLVLAVIVVSLIFILMANRFGLKFINTATSVVKFISDTLANLNIENKQVSEIIDLILQAIAYAIAINTNSDADTRSNDALDYIKNLSSKLDITLTDADIEIILQVLKATFAFISSLDIKVTNIKAKQVVKYNHKLQIAKLKKTE